MAGISIRRARCILFFATGGVGIGGWAASLPLVSAKTGLDKGELGLILLCFALGAIILMVNVGRILDRMRDPTRLSFYGSMVFGATIASIPWSNNTLALGALVCLAGAGFGTLDVSMNTEASETEKSLRKHMMSSFHGVFSIGNIVGAFLVGGLIQLDFGLAECLGAVGSLVMVTAIAGRILSVRVPIVTRAEKVGETGKVQAFTRSQRVLVLFLGAVGFLAMLAEGGLLDWTSVYMVTIHNTTESTGAYAFAVFAAAMACGRFLGDAATNKIGHVNMLKLGGGICAFSILSMLFFDNVTSTFIALAFCGLGVSNMIPAIFASAGAAGGASSGRAMAVATTLSYSGLLLGPALLGFIAQSTSLLFSFAVIMSSFLLVVISAFVLKPLFQKHADETTREAANMRDRNDVEIAALH